MAKRLLINSSPFKFLLTKSLMPLFEKYWIEFSPPRFKLIVNPGQRQVIVSNKSLTLFNSTSVWVKNSSEGCHVTSVPLPFTPLPEVLFQKLLL